VFYKPLLYLGYYWQNILYYFWNVKLCYIMYKQYFFLYYFFLHFVTLLLDAIISIDFKSPFNLCLLPFYPSSLEKKLPQISIVTIVVSSYLIFNNFFTNYKYVNKKKITILHTNLFMFFTKITKSKAFHKN
jgi:hypothetical protein